MLGLSLVCIGLILAGIIAWAGVRYERHRIEAETARERERINGQVKQAIERVEGMSEDELDALVYGPNDPK